MRFVVPLCLLWSAPLLAADRYVEVAYPKSDQPGELIYRVTYTLWIPDGVKSVRGIIVHQHGCGSGACKGGATAAYDLHWQELARRHECALLGPSYGQEDGQDCRKWCDPRNGSAKAFLRALDDLAKKAGHPEIATAPWCLWGHSGGGFWASIMQAMYPERIVAIWFRSGTAFSAWESGQIEKPLLPQSIYAIPMMLNPGAKENGDKRFNGAWTGSLAMFKAYSKAGALIGFAPDPRTSHECGDSRYLAIPFFDACLAKRLPPIGARDAKLRPMPSEDFYRAPLLGNKAKPAREYVGSAEESVWLPNAAVAQAWEEYVTTGAVSDTTPPPAPTDITATAEADGTIVLTWNARADFESGLSGFVIRRDGIEIGRLPAKPIGRYGRPLFQTMSYHDTPEKPLPEMRFRDQSGSATAKYEVIAVNSVGLKSR